MTTESAPDTDTDTEPDTVTDTDTTERARQLIGLLAEESRLRTFAAVALGADSPSGSPRRPDCRRRTRHWRCCGCANRAW